MEGARPSRWAHDAGEEVMLGSMPRDHGDSGWRVASSGRPGAFPVPTWPIDLFGDSDIATDAPRAAEAQPRRDGSSPATIRCYGPRGVQQVGRRLARSAVFRWPAERVRAGGALSELAAIVDRARRPLPSARAAEPRRVAERPAPPPRRSSRRAEPVVIVIDDSDDGGDEDPIIADAGSPRSPQLSRPTPASSPDGERRAAGLVRARDGDLCNRVLWHARSRDDAHKIVCSSWGWLEGVPGRRSHGALAADVVVADAFNIRVCSSDLQCLRPPSWLNDEVINYYMSLLAECSRGAVYCHSSFLFVKLQEGGYDSVRRWTRKVDLFARKRVLAPVNVGNTHWALICWDVESRSIAYYDPLGGSGQRWLALAQEYIEREARDKCASRCSADARWSVGKPPVQCPRQLNGYDCGVFVLAYAAYLAAVAAGSMGRSPANEHNDGAIPMRFAQADCNRLRRLIAEDIVAASVSLFDVVV